MAAGSSRFMAVVAMPATSGKSTAHPTANGRRMRTALFLRKPGAPRCSSRSAPKKPAMQ